MSYHILNRFDEQWFTKTAHEGTQRVDDLFFSKAPDDPWKRRRPSGLALRRKQQWLVVTASLVVAAFALLLALDARRRADDLEHRFTALEATTRK